MASTQTRNDTDRVEKMKALLMEGISYREVGRKFGITHERVRQLVTEDDPRFLEKVARTKEKLKTRKTEQRERDRIKELEARRGNCRICDQKIPASRPAKYTCKPEHQQIWNKIRFHIDPELRLQHREAQATTILNSETPEIYTDSQKAWAKAVLSDNPPPLRPPTFTNDKTGEVRATYEEWKRRYPDIAARVERENTRSLG